MEDLLIKPVAQPIVAAKAGAGLYGVHDTLRNGFHSVRNELAPAHPVQVIQENHDQQRDRLKFALQRIAFGSHLPVRLQMERHIVGQHQRLPVLPSSNLGLDILMGRDETLEFEDFLNDPQYMVGKHDVHQTMEIKLNMGDIRA